MTANQNKFFVSPLALLYSFVEKKQDYKKEATIAAFEQALRMVLVYLRQTTTSMSTWDNCLIMSISSTGRIGLPKEKRVCFGTYQNEKNLHAGFDLNFDFGWSDREFGKPTRTVNQLGSTEWCFEQALLIMKILGGDEGGFDTLSLILPGWYDRLDGVHVERCQHTRYLRLVVKHDGISIGMRVPPLTSEDKNLIGV